MNKYLLVIGSVTAKQYEPIRLQLLREGHQVKVERVSGEMWGKLLEDVIELVDEVVTGKLSKEEASQAYVEIIRPYPDFSYLSLSEILDLYNLQPNATPLRYAEELLSITDCLAKDLVGTYHFRATGTDEDAEMTLAVVSNGIIGTPAFGRLVRGFEEATYEINDKRFTEPQQYFVHLGQAVRWRR